MRFNDHEPFAVFDHLPSGLWPPWLSQHQIIQGDNLKADDNELVIVVNRQANVQLSDFVLFYHAANTGVNKDRARHVTIILVIYFP